MKTRIVITGGAGFIGSHLVEALLAEGARITVIDDLSSGNVKNIPTEADFVECDICSKQSQEVIIKVKPEYVFHYAAQVSVPRSVEEPVEDARTNVLGTVSLLEASAEAGMKKFVFTSSGGTLYGETRGQAATEEWPIRPFSPYGAAKASAEYYLQTFWSQHNLPYASLRLGNVFGPRQDGSKETGVIAIFLERMVNGKVPVIYGDGSQVRDYVFVEDVVDASLRAIRTEGCGAYNVGTGTGRTVRELFDALAEACGYSGKPSYGPPRPGDLQCNILDPSLIRRKLGWVPSHSFNEGLRETVHWYRNRA